MTPDIADRLRREAKGDRTEDLRLAALLVEAASTIDRMRLDLDTLARLERVNDDCDDGDPDLPRIEPNGQYHDLVMSVDTVVNLCEHLERDALRSIIARSAAGGRPAEVSARQLLEEPRYIAAQVIKELQIHGWSLLEAQYNGESER